MTSVSAGRIMLTPTQPVGSGWPQRESNPGPPHQDSRALTTELPPPPPPPPPRETGREGGGETDRERGRKDREKEREEGRDIYIEKNRGKERKTNKSRGTIVAEGNLVLIPNRPTKNTNRRTYMLTPSNQLFTGYIAPICFPFLFFFQLKRKNMFYSLIIHP